MSTKVISDEHLKRINTTFELTERKSGEYVLDQKHVMTKWIIRMLLGRDTSATNPPNLNVQHTQVLIRDELQVQNLYSGLFHIINEKIADGTGNATLPEGLEKYSKFRSNTQDLIACGFSGYEIIQNADGKKEIGYVPANEIVIGETITRYIYLKGQYQGEERNFLFVKKYFVGKNTNELFLLDKGSKQNGITIGFEALDLKYQQEETTGLQRLSIFLGEKEPLYEVVEQLVFTFERNLVNIQTQFYKYLEAWLVMRGVNFGKQDRTPEGGIKPEAIRHKIVTTNDPHATIEYIAMENPALDKLIEFTKQDLIRQISAITSIPTFYFGLEETGGIYGEKAIYLRLQDFVARCEKYREVHNEVFTDILEILGVQGSITWTDVIRPSNSDLLDEYKKAKDLGIITRKQMIMEYWDVDEKGAEALITQLDQEADAAMKRQQEMTTTLNPNTGADPKNTPGTIK